MERFTGWLGRFQILAAALVIPTGAAFAQSTAPAAVGRIEGLVTLSHDLSVPNRDPTFHNVFPLSSVKAFDLGCHIHSDMSAVVLVRHNRYFTVPNDTGRYAIDGVPAGDYRVVAWRERSHPALRLVHVEAGETSVVDFNIPLPPPESKR